MSEPTPVVSYARISSDLRGDEHGVQDQHKLNRETAARHGWAVVFEFTDNDKSAAKAGVFRDAFKAMLKALKALKAPGRDTDPRCGDRRGGPSGPAARRLRAVRRSDHLP